MEQRRRDGNGGRCSEERTDQKLAMRLRGPMAGTAALIVSRGCRLVCGFFRKQFCSHPVFTSLTCAHYFTPRRKNGIPIGYKGSIFHRVRMAG